MYYLGRKIDRIDTILERRNGKNWSNGVSFLDFDNFPQNISIGEYYQQVLIQNSFNWPTYINEHHNIYRSFGPMKNNSKTNESKDIFTFLISTLFLKLVENESETIKLTQTRFLSIFGAR